MGMELLFPLTIKIMRDKASKDASFIAYSPEFDVASCGPTEEKARKSLHEAVTLTLEEIEKKGKLDEFLTEHGFQKRQKQWIPPHTSLQFFVSLLE